LQSFISNQNEPEKVPEVSTKRIFPFLKRGQGLGRFRMSNNDLSAQRKRIVSTISKKKSPSLQSTDTKTEVAPRKEQLRPNKCLKANPAKPAIAPDLTQPPVPKKVKKSTNENLNTSLSFFRFLFHVLLFLQNLNWHSLRELLNQS
jgi:hypothetical protein